MDIKGLDFDLKPPSDEEYMEFSTVIADISNHDAFFYTPLAD
jgi:hypothetical protein